MPRRRITPLPDVAGLRLADPSRLESLPPHVLRLVLSRLNTAQSVTSLAKTSKTLHRVARTNGWRAIISSSYDTLVLPRGNADNQWMDLARGGGGGRGA